MKFIDEVRTRSGRFTNRLKILEKNPVTEEITKTSFVLPFIQMLGYDIFNPAEIVPEFTADVGIKQGEKVDFAILKDGKPTILIECKKLGNKLGADEMSQLLRYFGVTSARIGVLTNGINYLFFSDLDESNVMDARPFFTFNMIDFTEPQVSELERFSRERFSRERFSRERFSRERFSRERFSRERFDNDEIMDVARNLKHTTEIKLLLANELEEPSKEFLTFVIKQVYDGSLTSKVRSMFKDLTRIAFNQFISDKVQSRLENAMKQEGEAVDKQSKEDKSEISDPEFTENEQAGLITLKSILGGIVDVNCLALRKTVTTHPLCYIARRKDQILAL